MAVMFQRRLAIPLSAIAVLAVALTAPATAMFPMPTSAVFAVTALGIAAIVFLMPGSIPRWRTSRAPVRVPLFRHLDQAKAAITMAAGTGVRTLDETNRRAADDALDLVRMDDDGGWQRPRAAGNVERQLVGRQDSGDRHETELVGCLPTEQMVGRP